MKKVFWEDNHLHVCEDTNVFPGTTTTLSQHRLSPTLESLSCSPRDLSDFDSSITNPASNHTQHHHHDRSIDNVQKTRTPPASPRVYIGYTDTPEPHLPIPGKQR